MPSRVNPHPRPFPFRIANDQLTGINPRTNKPFCILYQKPLSFLGRRAHAPRFLEKANIQSGNQEDIGHIKVTHAWAEEPSPSSLRLKTPPLLGEARQRKNEGERTTGEDEAEFQCEPYSEYEAGIDAKAEAEYFEIYKKFLVRIEEEEEKRKRLEEGYAVHVEPDVRPGSSPKQDQEEKQEEKIVGRPENPLRLLSSASSTDLSLARARETLQPSPAPNSSPSQPRREESRQIRPLSAHRLRGWKHQGRKHVSPHLYPKQPTRASWAGEGEMEPTNGDIADMQVITGPISPMPETTPNSPVEMTEFEGVGKGEIHPPVTGKGKARVVMSREMRERCWPSQLMRRGVVIEED